MVTYSSAPKTHFSSYPGHSRLVLLMGGGSLSRAGSSKSNGSKNVSKMLRRSLPGLSDTEERLGRNSEGERGDSGFQVPSGEDGQSIGLLAD